MLRKRGRPGKNLFSKETSEETIDSPTSGEHTEAYESSSCEESKDANFSARRGRLPHGPKKAPKRKSRAKKIFPVVSQALDDSDSGISAISGVSDTEMPELAPSEDSSSGDESAPFSFTTGRPCASPISAEHSTPSEGIPNARPGSSATQCFNKLWPIGMWAEIAEQTNIYGRDFVDLKNKQLKHEKQWDDTDGPEIMKLHGLMVGMSIMKFASRDCYWRKGTIGAIAWPDYGRTMSRHTHTQTCSHTHTHTHTYTHTHHCHTQCHTHTPGIGSKTFFGACTSTTTKTQFHQAWLASTSSTRFGLSLTASIQLSRGPGLVAGRSLSTR